jgi:predicted HicB family RNase H-like nuclease
MSKVSLRLPGSLHQRARILASQDGVSINHFITLALAEKVAVLDKAADQKPSAQDRINP